MIKDVFRSQKMRNKAIAVYLVVTTKKWWKLKPPGYQLRTADSTRSGLVTMALLTYAFSLGPLWNDEKYGTLTTLWSDWDNKIIIL